jgi:hypothetical protein
MNLELIYPATQEGFDFKNIKAIPNRHREESGYYLIALVKRPSRISPERYVCFTNITKDQVWIEKVATLRSSEYLAFEDIRQIDNDEEWNEIFNFLKARKILE